MSWGVESLTAHTFTFNNIGDAFFTLYNLLLQSGMAPTAEALNAITGLLPSSLLERMLCESVRMTQIVMTWCGCAQVASERPSLTERHCALRLVVRPRPRTAEAEQHRCDVLHHPVPDYGRNLRVAGGDWNHHDEPQDEERARVPHHGADGVAGDKAGALVHAEPLLGPESGQEEGRRRKR
eukprot:2563871-Rhodomonas_salina.3